MKLLMFSMYPILNPRHGGQLRAQAIFNAYKEVKGFDVQYCGLVIEGFYEELGINDIVIRQDIFTSLDDSYAPDLALVKNIAKDKQIMDNLVSTLKDFAPDIIHCEQPFVYYLVKEAVLAINWKGKLIYGSQNIEYELRESILSNEDGLLINAKDIVREVYDLEKEAIDNANLVVACTSDDAKKLKEMGAKRIVLAPNGISPTVKDPENYRDWEVKLQQDKISKAFLFIGSAHSPNLAGFRELVGFGLGFMPSNTKIFIVGGIETLFNKELKEIPEHVAVAFKQRANILGAVSEEDLSSLILLCDCILLPITQGGGSNLKTAEAILSGKRIVATHKAFRGYEEYEDLSQVLFADNKDDFQEAIQKVISTDTTAIKPRGDTEKVTWEYRLNDLIESVKELSNG
jgi:hypothetical protein